MNENTIASKQLNFSDLSNIEPFQLTPTTHNLLQVVEWSNQKFFCRPEPTGLWDGYAPARLEKENNRVSSTD